MTVQDLKLNSHWQNASAFHLNNTQQIPTDPNSPESCACIPSESSLPPPRVYAIWANTFLFLSLLISLFVALLATLLQQWVRQYTRFTQQPGCSPIKRARVRAIYFEGVDKYRIFGAAEALPTLLHLSICLFIVGVIVWLFNINQPVFRAVIPLVALPMAAYLWFTSLPNFRPNIPFYSPLSPSIRSFYNGVSYVIKVLSSSMFCDILRNDYRIQISDGIGKTAEKLTWQRSSEIDARILISTLDALGEDSARAKFFEAIPGFLKSKHVVNLQGQLLEEFQIKSRRALDGFLDRTFSSSSISESVRGHQLIICLSATRAALGPDGVTQTLQDILDGRWRGMLQSIEMAQSLGRWSNSTNCDSQFAYYVRRIVTQVVVGATSRGRDNRWISLTRDEFGVSDCALRDKIAHGDSALLSLLIHMTRQAFRSGFWTPSILSTLTQFDMCNTLPELQHEFCSLWNQIVQEAQRGGADCTAANILREICQAYIGLHQGTDAFSAHTNCYSPVLAEPQSHRECNIASHHSARAHVPQEQTLVISLG